MGAGGKTVGLGVVGAGVTMLARKWTLRAMHDDRGRPKLPRAARKSNSVIVLLTVAAASGALLALAEILTEHRKQLADFT